MPEVNNFDILKKYVTERKIFATNSSVVIEPLSGGVSNSVLKISSNNVHYVLKQALPRRRVSIEWISHVARVRLTGLRIMR